MFRQVFFVNWSDGSQYFREVYLFVSEALDRVKELHRLHLNVDDRITRDIIEVTNLVEV